MVCAWNALISIMPEWVRSQLCQMNQEQVEEIRMRINSPPEIVVDGNSKWLARSVQEQDLSFCMNTASRYSPWAAESISQGYITAPGGHRIGICGEAVIKEGYFAGIRSVNSICIRVAKDYEGVAANAILPDKSVLILGAPGWGKTTVLRDLARTLALHQEVCVIDERHELFPCGFRQGKRMDILLGCPKSIGVEIALRTMGPAIIAVDEITAKRDAEALLNAANCGVRLLATAHAASTKDFYQRKIYSELAANRVFDYFILMHQDKTYSVEAAV